VLEKCGFELTGTVVEKWAKFSEPVELATYNLPRERWATPGRPGEGAGLD
jgi:RimJ/RimL family protein N-acetyltransferase